MAARHNIEIEGIDELAEELQQLTSTIEEGVRSAVRQSADAVRSEAQREVPEDTGNLRSSITDEIDSDGLGAEVRPKGQDTYYGAFIEFGTSSISAHPYMTPAAELERSEFPSRLREEVRKVLPS